MVEHSVQAMPALRPTAMMTSHAQWMENGQVGATGPLALTLVDLASLQEVEPAQTHLQHTAAVNVQVNQQKAKTASTNILAHGMAVGVNGDHGQHAQVCAIEADNTASELAPTPFLEMVAVNARAPTPNLDNAPTQRLAVDQPPEAVTMEVTPQQPQLHPLHHPHHVTIKSGEDNSPFTLVISVNPLK